MSEKNAEMFVCRKVLWWSPLGGFLVLSATAAWSKKGRKVTKTTEDVTLGARFTTRAQAVQSAPVDGDEWEVVPAPPVKYVFEPEPTRSTVPTVSVGAVPADCVGSAFS